MIAEWLNSTFQAFDYSIFEFFHSLAVGAGGILTPIADFLAIIGDNGYVSFAIAFILMCFPKTRKCGVCVLLAVGFGALFTNVAIKNIVARPRPFTSDFGAIKEWWAYVGSHPESVNSFPSGHTTAAMAAMTALCLAIGKCRKWVIAPAALYAFLMGASRIYLVVHYPSDVIAGFIVGGIAAVLAFFSANLLWKFIEKHEENKFWSFVLNFDIRKLFKKKENSEEKC